MTFSLCDLKSEISGEIDIKMTEIDIKMTENGSLFIKNESETGSTTHFYIKKYFRITQTSIRREIWSIEWFSSNFPQIGKKWLVQWGKIGVDPPVIMVMEQNIFIYTYIDRKWAQSAQPIWLVSYSCDRSCGRSCDGSWVSKMAKNWSHGGFGVRWHSSSGPIGSIL